MENVEQLLQLSDEYQVTEHIFKPCVEFLKDKPKTKENVMKIRALAEFYDVEEVRQDCDELLGNMLLGTLSETVQFENVEKDKLRHFLTQRIEVLEGYLEKLYPQFMGLLECCLWLWHENKRSMEWCPTHFSKGKVNFKLDECIKSCKVCQKMLGHLASSTFPRVFGRFRNDETYDFCKTYGYALLNRHRFDECLPNIIQRYSQVMVL